MRRCRWSTLSLSSNHFATLQQHDVKGVLKTRVILERSPKPMKDNKMHTPIPGRYAVVVGCSWYVRGVFVVY